VPLLLNLQPSGGYFMEDFYYAGGLPVVIKELSAMLHQSVITANGKTMAENSASAEFSIRK
jgi:L-arabonate dehydrase